MACRFEVTLDGHVDHDASHLPAARQALDEADRLEAQLTIFRDTSEIARVNRLARREPVRVDKDLSDFLARCRQLHAETDGAFDITSTPLSRCWGFLTREGRLPAPAEIDAARAQVGMDAVALDPSARTVRFTRDGLELNLGSIGKGHALDRMGALMANAGVRHALLSAGASSVLALGGRHRGWTIDLRSPQVERERIARLHLRSGALGTSGAGEQFVTVDGRRYGHIIDPRTGWPASGVLSVSVVTSDAETADALSTAFLIGGRDLAKRYCDAHPGTLAILTPGGLFGHYVGAIIDIADSSSNRET